MTEAILSKDSARKGIQTIPLKELTNVLNGRWESSPPDSIASVRIDSRKCEPGDLFVALEGNRTDGHEYLDDASARGASAAFVREKQDVDLPQFVVDEPESALQNLAVEYRTLRDDLLVIGITGSCGKTTVKELLASMLRKKYELGQTPGNRNNQLGVPLTLLNHGRGDVLVLEMGMNSPGEIEQLTKWARPEIGIITHIGPAHLKELGSIEVVAREKAQLFYNLPQDGLAFLPEEIPREKQLAQISSVDPIRVRYKKLQEEANTVEVRVEDEIYTLPYRAPYMIQNISLAIVVSRQLGLSADRIQQVLENFELLSGRGKVHHVADTRILDGSYNANPDSFRVAIERLQSFSAPRLVLAGDMWELGEEAERFHRDLGEQLAELDQTEIIYVGEFCDEVRAGLGSNQNAHWFESVEELPQIQLSDYRSVLVKSSHGVGLHNIVDEWLDKP